MTARQLEVLRYLRAFTLRHQRPPTFADIALHFHFSRNAAKGHVEALERLGAVRRESGRHRALAVLA